LAVGHLRLAHAVANDLAAAKLHLFAVDGEVLLDLDDEIGVGEPYTVTYRGAEHVGIGCALHCDRHISSPVLSTANLRHLPAPLTGVGFLADQPSSAHAELG
jgi:hypothetical protein